jgi:hypothetical protein
MIVINCIDFKGFFSVWKGLEIKKASVIPIYFAILQIFCEFAMFMEFGSYGYLSSMGLFQNFILLYFTIKSGRMNFCMMGGFI